MKYKTCSTCWYETMEKDEESCSNCEQTDAYDFEPPTNYKYEDPEGEWK